MPSGPCPAATRLVTRAICGSTDKRQLQSASEATLLNDFLHFAISARVSNFSHVIGGHRAHGIAFVGKFFALGLASIVALTAGAMATLSVSNWIEKRYGNTQYARAAGWMTFLVITIVIGLGIARFL